MFIDKTLFFIHLIYLISTVYKKRNSKKIAIIHCKDSAFIKNSQKNVKKTMEV